MLADHAELIASTYDLGAPIAPLAVAARGEQGRMWRLDTDRGAFAVKQLIRRQLEADALVDLAYQEHVLAQADVFMPVPVRTTSNGVLADVGDDQVRVYEWVDLLPLDLGIDPSVIGETVAAIHRVPHEPAPSVDWWYTDAVGAETWSRLLDAAVREHRSADALREEIPTLITLESFLEPPTDLQNCHRDLWADNMLPAADGHVCVIDWENCGLEEPGHELPMVLFDFAYRDPVRAMRLWNAYVDAGGPARPRGRGAFTMVIAQFGHFWQMAIEEYVREGASDDERAHAIARVAELQDRPLRVDDVDEAVEVLETG